jgi:hypothetical protein
MSGTWVLLQDMRDLGGQLDGRTDTGTHERNESVVLLLGSK